MQAEISDVALKLKVETFKKETSQLHTENYQRIKQCNILENVQMQNEIVRCNETLVAVMSEQDKIKNQILLAQESVNKLSIVKICLVV